MPPRNCTPPTSTGHRHFPGSWDVVAPERGAGCGVRMPSADWANGAVLAHGTARRRSGCGAGVRVVASANGAVLAHGTARHGSRAVRGSSAVSGGPAVRGPTAEGLRCAGRLRCGPDRAPVRTPGVRDTPAVPPRPFAGEFLVQGAAVRPRLTVRRFLKPPSAVFVPAHVALGSCAFSGGAAPCA